MIFILQFVNMMCHTDWFADAEKYLHPWDKSHFIVVFDNLSVLLNSFC